MVGRNREVKPSDKEQPYGKLGSPFTSFIEEIEARAPIKNNMKFDDDNLAMWKILYATVKESHYFTHIKKFQRQQDGRNTYLTLYDSLLGRQAIQNQTNRLRGLSWDGKTKKGWNFDKYILAHKDQHIILGKAQRV